MAHDRSFIQAHDRLAYIRRPGIQLQHILHSLNELLCHLRHAPHSFPPRPQIVVGQHASDCLAPDGADNASTHRRFCNESDGPTSAPFGCRTAHHCDDRGLLRAGEHLLWFRPWIVGQDELKTSGEVALPDTPNFAWVASLGFRSRANGAAVIQQQQLPNTPISRLQLLSRVSLFFRSQELAVGV
jgi:hypothetical protein